MIGGLLPMLRRAFGEVRIRPARHKGPMTPLETIKAEKPKITFLGGGNMAKALIGGIVHSGISAETIRVSDPFEQARQSMVDSFPGIQTFVENREAWADSDVVVMAVKPNMIHGVCDELKATYSGKLPLIVSIAAGVRGADLMHWLGGHSEVIRVMPNTPALVQTGVTGMWAAPGVTEKQHKMAEGIFDGVGITCWVDEESKLDTAVTPLSGSSPAYFFLFMESMINVGKELGLDEEMSRRLVVQTCAGAAKMVAESDEPVSVLKQRVMSPNGTTEAAVRTFEDMGIRILVDKAMRKCGDRAVEIGNELHNS